MKYDSFIFEDYIFEKANKTLTLKYSFDDGLHFEEVYKFDFDFVEYNPEILERALQALFFMAGVSYFKVFPFASIEVKKGTIDKESAEFYSKTYENGLGEFFFVNNLDAHTKIPFPANSESLQSVTNSTSNHGLVVGVGGGKDSLVSIELLRPSAQDISTWSVGHRPQLSPLVERIGLTHYWVERIWDRQLLDINKQGGLNGHVPISAILACAGSVVAVLTGKSDVIVSNESSANEPTLEYMGLKINHQYSKSLEFETDYQEYLSRTVGSSVRYYSLLRSFSEVAIAEMFAKVGFEKYFDVFSSCNRAFVHSSDHIYWDGTCPKCAFVFLALTPFIERQKLEQLFDNKNLLLNPELKNTYLQLLGIEGNKPLECVGEIKETRAAMRLAQEIYPNLSEYVFDIPANYNFRTKSLDRVPEYLRSTIESASELLE
jgi:hypothetical protein